MFVVALLHLEQLLVEHIVNRCIEKMFQKRFVAAEKSKFGIDVNCLCLSNVVVQFWTLDVFNIGTDLKEPPDHLLQKTFVETLLHLMY